MARNFVCCESDRNSLRFFLLPWGGDKLDFRQQPGLTPKNYKSLACSFSYDILSCCKVQKSGKSLTFPLNIYYHAYASLICDGHIQAYMLVSYSRESSNALQRGSLNPRRHRGGGVDATPHAFFGNSAKTRLLI